MADITLHKCLIDGQFVAGEGVAEAIFNPSTGEVIANINEASLAQVEAATKAAAIAFQTWGKTQPKDRATMLLALADSIDDNAETLAELESLNCGKPYAAALGDELPAVADVFRYFAGAARNLHGSAAGEYLAGHTSMIRRDPVGVIASIAPWNYPLMMAAWKLGPALAAGNTCVLKP
ncbi:MAG: aldehyde dehydrogenase family protein, partial [Methylophilaceae bacterium]